MLALKIIALLLGAAFTIFGYFIFFRKKYSLINGFVFGKSRETYARRVGFVEFIIGVGLLAAGIILVIFF